MTQSRANSWRDNESRDGKSVHWKVEGREENLRSNRLKKFASIFVTYLSRCVCVEIGATDQGGDREQRNESFNSAKMNGYKQIRKREAGRRGNIQVALLCASSYGEIRHEGEGFYDSIINTAEGFTARTNHTTCNVAKLKGTSCNASLCESTTSERNIVHCQARN